MRLDIRIQAPWLARAVDEALCRTLDRAVGAAALPILRAVFGRWPNREEIAAFRYAHRAGGKLPPLLQTVAALPSARPMVTAAALDAWLPAGAAGSSAALMLANRPRAAFLHLEKTGGSSVLAFLLEQYHPGQMMAPAPDGENAAELLTQRAPHDRLLIFGHYDLPFLFQLDPGRFVFTFLRAPRARILSVYYYWRSSRASHDGTEVHPAAVAAARLGLLDFLRSDMPEIRNSVDNFYTRRLTGRSVVGSIDDLNALPEETLALAQAGLADLGFVGLTERMDESLRRLALCLNLIPPLHTPRINAVADIVEVLVHDFRAVEREPITPAIEAELARLTRFDQLLYETACRRFDAPALGQPALGQPVLGQPAAA